MSNKINDEWNFKEVFNILKDHCKEPPHIINLNKIKEIEEQLLIRGEKNV